MSITNVDCCPLRGKLQPNREDQTGSTGNTRTHRTRSFRAPTGHNQRGTKIRGWLGGTKPSEKPTRKSVYTRAKGQSPRPSLATHPTNKSRGGVIAAGTTGGSWRSTPRSGGRRSAGPPCKLPSRSSSRRRGRTRSSTVSFRRRQQTPSERPWGGPATGNGERRGGDVGR